MRKWIFILLAVVAACRAQNVGYLAAYMTGDDERHLYYAVADTAFRFHVINEGKPILSAHYCDSLIRDPMLFRDQQGIYHMVATVSWSKRPFTMWDSDDMLHWKNERLIDVAPEGATKTWAPEIAYDEEEDVYIVYWTAEINNDWSTAAIYYATTRNFKEFSAPQVLYREEKDGILDANLIKANWLYHLFYRDNGVWVVTSEHAQGPYSNRRLVTNDNVEGPYVFPLNDGDGYGIVWDYFGGSRGFGLSISKDLQDWQRVTNAQEPFYNDNVCFPKGIRHGSIRGITQEELDFLKNSKQQTQSWIWYPGDIDIWMGNKINNLRTERGSFYPAFWRADSHEQTVEFQKTVELTEAEEVEIHAEGQYGIKIDNDYLFGMPESFMVSNGKHTLHIVVHNNVTPPALWLKGKTILSDTTWTVNNYAVSTKADTWTEADGSLIFTHPQQRPSCYHLPVTEIQPVKVQPGGKEIFAEWERECIGYLWLNGVKGNGQLNIYYGESPDEARDKEYAYLIDKVIFTADSIIDLATMTTNKRQGQDYRLACSRAMRYAMVECVGNITVDGVTLLSEMKDVERRGSFECNDTLINHIWQVGAYTLHLTDREVMIEGIKRDRWMWSGDAIQSYLMNYYAFFDTPVVKRTIWALRGKDPVQQHINTILDYTFYWFNAIYDYYLYTGDAGFVRQIYPRMKTLMDYAQSRLNERGMVEGQQGDWVFVDWSPQWMPKDGELAFEQLVYLRSLQTMQQCASLVGNSQDTQQYGDAAERLRSLIIPTFWNEAKGALVHHTKEGQQQSVVTRYANIFAVLYGLLDEEQRKSVLTNVLQNDSVMEITTPYMRFYELEALCALGLQRQVLQEMRAYWGGMLAQGATTFWETYDPKEGYPERLAMYGNRYGKSLCHAWGASPVYLLGKYYLGIPPKATYTLR